MLEHNAVYDASLLHGVLEERRQVQRNCFNDLQKVMAPTAGGSVMGGSLFLDMLLGMARLPASAFPPRSLKDLLALYPATRDSSDVSCLQSIICYLACDLVQHLPPETVIASLGREYKTHAASQNALAAFWRLDNGKIFGVWCF